MKTSEESNTPNVEQFQKAQRNAVLGAHAPKGGVFEATLPITPEELTQQENWVERQAERLVSNDRKTQFKQELRTMINQFDVALAALANIQISKTCTDSETWLFSKRKHADEFQTIGFYVGRQRNKTAWIAWRLAKEPTAVALVYPSSQRLELLRRGVAEEQVLVVADLHLDLNKVNHNPSVVFIDDHSYGVGRRDNLSDWFYDTYLPLVANEHTCFVRVG